MPLKFNIFPRRGLVLIQYTGFVRFSETLAAFGEYMQHPDCRPGQKQLVDLSGVTGFEKDFASLMAIQARKADAFAGNGIETLIVYCAPTAVARDMSGMVLRSWDSFDDVIPLIQDNEADALALLGQPEKSFNELLARANKV